MLPEIVAGIVVCGHTDGDFWQADRTKRFNHSAHQKRANAHTARVGIDRRVVDARPSAVVTGKNRSNNPSAIVFGYETGVGIAFEERFIASSESSMSLMVKPVHRVHNPYTSG